MNDSWNSVLDLLVYSKCPIKWNSDHRYKTPALRHHYPSWWWHVLFGMALHILHCCKHCVKQFKGTFGSIAESMSVKLPATLNIQPKYVFYTWANTQSLWVPLFCHQVIISGDAQCCNKDCCECLLMRPRDGNFTQNGDPRVGKLTFENWKCQISCWLPAPQTIDRCIRSNVTTVQTKHCVTPQAAQTHVAREGCNVIYITYVTRRCRVTDDRWKYKRLCMGNISLRSANAK